MSVKFFAGSFFLVLLLGAAALALMSTLQSPPPIPPVQLNLSEVESAEIVSAPSYFNEKTGEILIRAPGVNLHINWYSLNNIGGCRYNFHLNGDDLESHDDLDKCSPKKLLDLIWSLLPKIQERLGNKQIAESIVQLIDDLVGPWVK